LHMRHATQYVEPRIALIGDAAHTIHPLAGQGVNLGLLDAACLIQVLQETLAKKGDIGNFLTLRRYERWRKGENLLMIAAMEGFKRLFGSRSSSLMYLRNLGLKITHDRLWLKSQFMRRAMGLAGDLPSRALPADLCEST
jgi:2-polyprenylphenol 6-hydroxylase